jgi:hypothetical protein
MRDQRVASSATEAGAFAISACGGSRRALHHVRRRIRWERDELRRELGEIPAVPSDYRRAVTVLLANADNASRAVSAAIYATRPQTNQVRPRIRGSLRSGRPRTGRRRTRAPAGGSDPEADGPARGRQLTATATAAP